MPSLRQLLAAHAPLLLVDAASARIQAALFGADGTARWQISDEEAGVGVFQCVEQLGVELDAVRAFAFCEGPGSILGIRTTAMALRTWGVLAPRPVFAYGSLAVVAAALGRPDVSIIADARRDSWHCLQLGGLLRRIPTAGLAGELLMPEGFRHWTTPPPGAGETPYLLSALFALPAVAGADLFQAAAAPDAFLHAEPDYATWTPRVHRAAAPS